MLDDRRDIAHFSDPGTTYTSESSGKLGPGNRGFSETTLDQVDSYPLERCSGSCIFESYPGD